MKYSALIEIEDAKLSFNNPVKVLKDFDTSRPLGTANLYEKDGKLFADIETKEPIQGLFPAIGHNTHKIFCVGVSASPNVDERIQPIS